jgi:hypothetical protein
MQIRRATAIVPRSRLLRRMIADGERRLFLLLASAGVLFSIACGKKGNPEPPLAAVPSRTTDLSVGQEGTNAVLRFRYPERLVNGERLTDLAKIDVYRVDQPAPTLLQEVHPRAVTSSSDRAPLAYERQRSRALHAREQSFFAQARRIARLSPGELAEFSRGAEIVYAEPIGAPGAPWPRSIGFAVVSSRRRGERSELSNVALLEPLVPPGPPELLPLAASEGLVCVSWRPPSRNLEGGPTDIGGYLVYRRKLDEADYGEPLNPAPVDIPLYRDSTVVSGQAYVYVVRATAKDHPKIAGAPSEEDGIVYRDVYPPAPVARLDALPEADVIHLIWQPVAAADLAGYLIDRSVDGGARVRLNDKPVEEPLYDDRAVAAGHRYRYWVRSVDRSGNQSADSPVAEAEPF